MSINVPTRAYYISKDFFIFLLFNYLQENTLYAKMKARYSASQGAGLVSLFSENKLQFLLFSGAGYNTLNSGCILHSHTSRITAETL